MAAAGSTPGSLLLASSPTELQVQRLGFPTEPDVPHQPSLFSLQNAQGALFSLCQKLVFLTLLFTTSYHNP